MQACVAARRAAARLRRAGLPATTLRALATHAPADDAAAAPLGAAAAPAATPPQRSPGGAAPLHDGPLYDGHVRLTAPQRAAVAVGSAVGALIAPARADLVAALGCARLPGAAAPHSQAIAPRSRAALRRGAAAAKPRGTARWSACAAAWLRTPTGPPSWRSGRASRTPRWPRAGTCRPVRVRPPARRSRRLRRSAVGLR